ncbi:protealysin inhibitor emfourin [Mycobacterium sp.]|uniref:protealysin inhibitor emfourin n=1 Tax=Mycobacterium sp. TaxID=1785 RepID=UPI003D145D3B
MSAPVHIDYRRSGGLAGIDMTASVDSGDLPSEDGTIIADLLADTPGVQDRAAAMPDAFSYELTLTDGTRTRTCRWQEPEIPDAVRPLLAALTARALPAPAV